jgi:5-methylcytosine-specific restriction endonuclease McrA
MPFSRLEALAARAAASRPPRLEVELVPRTCWWSNLRSLVEGELWDVLRRQVYRQAGYRCELCGGRGPAHPVECHEVWAYDDRTWTQRLVRLRALCPDCHEVKHYGYASTHGRGPHALAHLARVNGWTLEQAAEHVDDVWAVWEVRSLHSWRLDLVGLGHYLLPGQVAALQARADQERAAP